MRIAILIALLLSIATLAQDDPETWASLSACKDADTYRLSIHTQGEIDSLMLVPSVEDAFMVTRRHYAISLENDSAWLVVFTPFGSFTADILSLEGSKDCNAMNNVDMNECLNVSPLDYNLPLSGVFTVDGQDYGYADNLSFLVPDGMEWTWDLFSNGVLVLSFEQSKDAPCHILED